MKLGGGRGVLAVVGLPQAGQPGVGQVSAPLGQPQLAFDQGDHRQVIDRRHIPDVHQALGLGQFGKSMGKLPTPPFEAGDDAVPDQHADIAAGTGLGQAGAQTRQAGLGLVTHQQQVAFVQRQACAHGIQALGRQPMQALKALADFIQGTQDLPPRLQHPRPVVMGQGFKQGVTDALRQFQRFAVQATGAPQVGIDDRQVGQGREAHQALAVTLLRQAFQRLLAIALGQLTVSAPTGNNPAQRQPLGQHGFLRGGRWRRQEAAEVAGQLLRCIQLACEPQRPAVQHDQTRRADQQAVGQVHLPAQQHADVLLCQQLLFGQVLHQVRRHIQMPGPQRLLHRLVDQALGVKPATGAQVQAGRRQGGAFLAAGAQQVGEQMVIAVPVPLLIQRHQEHLMSLQIAQDFCAVMGLADGVA